MLQKIVSPLLAAIGLFFALSCTIHAQTPINALFHNSNDPVSGNPDGNVTIVEFSDYQCGHCIKMAMRIRDMINTKANSNVRFVFKDYPVLGPDSRLAAQAALAAHLQGKYDSFSYQLFTTNQNLTEDTILSLAKKIGLNTTKLQKDMYSSYIKTQIQQNLALGRQLGVTGTPAFFIGATAAKNLNGVDFILGETTERQLQDELNKFKSALRKQ